MVPVRKLAQEANWRTHFFHTNSKGSCFVTKFFQFLADFGGNMFVDFLFFLGLLLPNIDP